MEFCKKQKTSHSNRLGNNNVVSTTSEISMIQLHEWFLANNVVGLGRVDFKYSKGDCGGSLGCFARDAIRAGETIFIIPQSCIIGISNATGTLLSIFLRRTVLKNNLPHKITSELLIWLHMIEQRSFRESQFNVYLNSLDKVSPSPMSWNPRLLEALEGTNLGKSIEESRESLKRHMEFLETVRKCEPAQAAVLLPSDIFTLDALIWAKGHYLARRYPGDFSLKHTSHTSNEGKTLSPSSSSANDHREPGLQNLGSLVPLLDILNHNDEHDWLKLEVYNNCLYVKCNHAVEKGAELFSNYGHLSNEKLLFAYGFAMPANQYDAVAVKLRSAAGGAATAAASVDSDLGVYYIESGGITGVPASLWSVLATFSGAGASGGQPHSPSKQSGVSESAAAAAPIEVGIDECVVLCDYLTAKLEQYDEVMIKAKSILREFGVTLDSIQLSDESDTADATISEDQKDIRAEYISYYLDGQHFILRETLEALEDMIEQAEEEEEGDEDSDNADEEHDEEEGTDGDEEGEEN